MEESKDVGCKDCGLPYSKFGMDTIIPNQQWVDIHPGRTVWSDCNGLLCASCMVKRAAALIDGAIAAHMVFEIVPTTNQELREENERLRAIIDCIDENSPLLDGVTLSEATAGHLAQQQDFDDLDTLPNMGEMAATYRGKIE